LTLIPEEHPWALEKRRQEYSAPSKMELENTILGGPRFRPRFRDCFLASGLRATRGGLAVLARRILQLRHSLAQGSPALRFTPKARAKPQREYQERGSGVLSGGGCGWTAQIARSRLPAASARPRHVVVSQIYKATYLLQIYATIPRKGFPCTRIDSGESREPL